MKYKTGVRKILILLLILLFSCSSKLFCETKNSTTPEPYEEDEFPEWAKDLRRGEIIAFGSMPFVTTWVTVGYGLVGMWIIPEGNKYHLDDFPNPLDKSKNIFTEDQIKLVVSASAIISIGLGITDFIINNSKRNKLRKEMQLKEEMKGKSTVTPLTPEEAGELLRKNSVLPTETENVHVDAESYEENNVSQTEDIAAEINNPQEN